MKQIGLALALAALSLIPLPLRSQEMQRFTVAGGAGFTSPVGNTAKNVDMGWNVQGGAGINFTPYVGAMVNLGYSSMGVNGAVLDALGYGGGTFSIFSATVDPVVHLNPKGRVDVYVTGGGGLYHRNQNFTQPGVSLFGGFDPFGGVFQIAEPANIVVASYSENDGGVDVGAGIAFGSKWHGRFFAEAKYNHIYNRSARTDYIPVTFGFRW